MLTPREKEIIVKRYGLNNQKEMTQKGIAKELKIPNEICQSFIIVYYEQDKKHIIHITKDSIYEVKS